MLSDEGDQMNIVGFNFTKIDAQRLRAAVGKINISNNISIKDVKETKIGLGESRSALSVEWNYMSNYKPDIAHIKFDGEVLLLLEPKKAEEIKKDWSKNKRLPNELATHIMNHVLEKCNIQALLISKDLNLPAPVPLPKVRVGGSTAKTEDVKKEAPKPAKKK